MVSLDENIEKISGVAGVDLIYFLDNNCQIIKEKNKTNCLNYLEQVKNIIKSDFLTNKKTPGFYSKPFHTCTLLNENGLIIVSKLASKEDLYMIIIAGENEPVDLLGLMKLCNETHN